VNRVEIADPGVFKIEFVAAIESSYERTIPNDEALRVDGDFEASSAALGSWLSPSSTNYP
jgi:hypothetical protein